MSLGHRLSQWVVANPRLSNPLLWPLLSLALILLTFLLDPSPDVYAFSLFGMAVAAPVVGMIANVIYYPLNEKYLGRLVAVYVSLMLLFANIYFIILALDTGRSAFEGIAPGGLIEEGR